MTKTTVKTVSIEKLASIVKPFIGPTRAKTASRPILKTALVNHEYIIATDSHRLIRIKHRQDVPAPYLHHFKKEMTDSLSVSSYPNVDRLLPNPHDAKQEVKMKVAEWIEAHELGLIAAKEHKNNTIKLQGNQFLVNEEMKNKDRMYSDDKSYFDDIAFKYVMDKDTGIEKIAYSCEYMLDALKVLKKLGQKEATLYFYGPLRPMYIIAGDVEILILPVRTV